jgi:catechol 2,3-dioxygenase-like lactoylglutathione lyase family enzyme
MTAHSNPICFRGIDHVVLRVVNLERMLEFYCEVVGCVVERRVDELGLVQLRAGHSLIDLVSVESKLGEAGGDSPGQDGRNMDHFCLRLEEFDGERITGFLNSHGIVAGQVLSRYGAEGQGPSMYVDDPEGNCVELKGAPWPQGSD